MNNFAWANLFRSDSKEKSVLETLKQTHIFGSLSKRELQLVIQTIHVRDYAPGEIVFSQGELGIGMYIILNGKVDVMATDPSGSDEPRLVTQLESGDFFGELALVEKQGRRTATAKASVESSLIGFFKPDLLEILDRQPQTGSKIVLRLAEVLGRRLKQTSVKLTELRAETLKNSGRTKV
ncbi:MAG TPA: cyclic nucleotide-binding domain-containing protein [Bdellovibrionales bacterium]|nr:cAMP-binding protein [Pseudobdellovibrionaceae bacterium]HAG91462.1 cyclic nucleotide-binding domain-containing protein [Bdellovibrionales bacterium]|tara:strand:- start:1299 stop:1838 length:540 start_codon:yes stop_codon:yes gene_type:complete